MCTGYLYRG